MRINWGDKSQNLREIAQELNIGTDSLAFLDDNPFEREQVRAALPEVTVIDISGNPMEYAAAVRDCPVFERLGLSAEDQQRTAMYAVERERTSAEHKFQSKEDFFRFLEQSADLDPVTDLTLARVAQLTQKTNQFNTTTRRYSEAQIAEMAKRQDWHIFSIKVRDRYGDHGLVGVAITRDEGEQCEIDVFLLSCRVIGRTVETALLAHLAKSAADRGCKRLVGWFLPTKKNAPARDFYQQHGFVLGETDDSGTLWVLELKSSTLASPDWIKLNVAEAATKQSVKRNQEEDLSASTFDEVRSIASDIMGVPAARLNAASSPDTVENWDSVQHLNLVLALEEKFSLQLSPEEIDQMKTLGDTAAMIEVANSGPLRDNLGYRHPAISPGA